MEANVLALYATAVYGMSRLLSRNYRYPFGLGFGGRRLSRLAQVLIEQVAAGALVSGSGEVFFIDVHKGLSELSVGWWRDHWASMRWSSTPCSAWGDGSGPP